MPEEHANNILKTTDLAIGYKSRRQTTLVADHINVELKKGSFVCVLGKNGSGKSTLLRTLSKVQSKLSGEITINNKRIEEISNEGLAKIMSLVLTERIPDNNLTVYELIALGRQPYTNWIGKLTDADYDHINKAIAETQLTDLIDKKHYKLSDGQIQKVMIAKSLSQDTEIITLDEPTAHLDIQNKIEIFKLLKKLAVELNKTILISTHEIQLALQLSDALWLMDKQSLISGNTGQLIADSSISKLFVSDHIKFDDKTKQFIID